MKVKIEKLDYFGRGICSVNDKICFVENALSGEEVDIEITSEKSKFCEAKVSKYYKESESRQNARCPYFSVCGGCQLQMVDFNYENNFKREKVCELVEHYTDLDRSKVLDIYYDQEFNYRNKIVLHVKNGEIGLYEKDSHKIIEISECLLVNQKINKVINFLKGLDDLEKIEEIMIRIGNKTGDIMVSIKGDFNNYLSLLEIVDVLIINGVVKTPQSKIISYIRNRKYYVSEKSFFQINEKVTEKLYNYVRDLVISVNSKKLLDLYCGTGTIGIYVSDLVEEVFGIEVVDDAIRDAYRNKDLNDVENIDFKVGKVENLISSIKNKYDTVIVDPPRSGLDKRVVDVLNNKIRPKTIIYVSCGVNTLIRDLNNLSDNYDVESIKPFNMFPRTHHVECVSVLSRKPPVK